VGRLLVAARQTTATAESCTGGLLGAALTRVPGSSGWYRGGWIVYEDALKTELTGVPSETVERHGAVSEAVARELAASARRLCGADFGLGLTGIAGPGGGSPAKPLGLVHLAIQDSDQCRHWHRTLAGDREAVRLRAVAFALDRLRRLLIGAP
jgi:PncC family amidohydrolase